MTGVHLAPYSSFIALLRKALAMDCRRTALAILLFLVVFTNLPVRTAEQTLIPAGSAWKYNDSGTNLGTAWRSAAYNDVAWATGSAQLGYGDGDEATVLSYGSNPNNRRMTYYFRRAFTVANPAALAALTVRYLRDDGCIIYINGAEVVRSNMPSGTVSYTTRASVAISGTAESSWLEAPVDPALLVAGANIISVELHQQSPTSTDISFDLELRATEAATPTPTVSLTSPTNHGVSNDAAVVFAAAVSAPSGLESATLFVGAPPQTVVFSGPIQVEDAQITADTPTLAAGGDQSINVDGQAPHAHGLLKFPSLIGSLSGQVPAGAIVTSAILQLNCTNAGQSMRIYRLTQNWVEDDATWNERAAGLAWGSAGADGLASNAGTAVTGDCTVTGQRLIDLTLLVQEWSNGSPNYGVVMTESGTDGVDFSSSESSLSPMLTVSYKSSQVPVATQLLSGTTADVSFSTELSIGQTYFWNVQVTDTLGQHTWAPSDFELTLDASSPDAPVLVTPPDGSTGVDVSTPLAVTVSNPDGGTLDVSMSLRKAAQPEFTIIALPDTQHYSDQFPAIFTSQTQWIVNNKSLRNIVFVTHEGDIVEHYNDDSEWTAANVSMSLLDGVVPYGMGPGNHDVPTTKFNQIFPYQRYDTQPWYGGHYGTTNDNNYQLFSAGGMDFVIVHLTYCPAPAVVSWADGVFKTYPDRVGIFTTHAYLDGSAQRTTHGCGSTQFLWDGLAVPNPNLRFMLSGHVHAESRRTDIVNGRPVFQMLADYQDRASGGEGWLRILRFVPAESKVYVQTYSPWLNRFEGDADSEFTLDFPMGGAFETAGAVTAASGATASITPPALEPNTQYEWQVTVTNDSGKSQTGPVWRFTTGSGGQINQPPTADSQSVSTPEDSPLAITLAANDPDGSPLTYIVVTGPTHGTLGGSAPLLTYQPAANYHGTDAFTFRVSDGLLSSALATISIAIQAVNDPPLGAAEAYTVQSGSTLTVAAPGVLGNDADIDGGTLVAQLVSGPTRGSLTLNTDGSLTYTPTAGYSGTDAFSYRASDGLTTSLPVTVGLTITPAPPVDTTAPAVTLTAPAAGTVSGNVTLSAMATDAVGVVGVQFLLNGSPLGAEDTTAPYTIVWNSTSVANGGPYTLSARARDNAANQATSTAVSVTVSNGAVTGLVAAYSFNEGTGSTLVDRSGRGHTGTISGATWSTPGKFGGALSFDGVNDWVTVGDTAALDLTTGMTLEAWVQPSSLGGWRNVIIKERANGETYNLYAHTDSNTPAVFIVNASAPGTPLDAMGTSTIQLNSWTHLAATYDGTSLRLYVNGVLVGTRATGGAMLTSTGVLRIGGNGIWGEFFQGRIDEIRVYNRALTLAEIQADMNSPITP